MPKGRVKTFRKPKMDASYVRGQDWNKAFVVPLTYPALVWPNVDDLYSVRKTFAKLASIASS